METVTSTSQRNARARGDPRHSSRVPPDGLPGDGGRRYATQATGVPDVSVNSPPAEPQIDTSGPINPRVWGCRGDRRGTSPNTPRPTGLGGPSWPDQMETITPSGQLTHGAGLDPINLLRPANQSPRVTRGSLVGTPEWRRDHPHKFEKMNGDHKPPYQRGGGSTWLPPRLRGGEGVQKYCGTSPPPLPPLPTSPTPLPPSPLSPLPLSPFGIFTTAQR